MSAPAGHELVHQLVALRVRQHITQQDLADRIRVDRSTIARFETETLRRRSPSLLVLQRYANAVGARIVVACPDNQPQEGT